MPRHHPHPHHHLHPHSHHHHHRHPFLPTVTVLISVATEVGTLLNLPKRLTHYYSDDNNLMAVTAAVATVPQPTGS